MKYRILAFLGAALLCWNSGAMASTLWQNTESGMSPGQVKSAFPLAAPPMKPSTLKGGAVCELALENYEIGGDTYRVCFFFVDHKLTQVMLSANEPNQPMFRSVVDLLRSKYGSELGAGKELCRPGLLLVCGADWALKTGTNVGVTFMQVGGSAPIMNINYQTRMANEASKL